MVDTEKPEFLRLLHACGEYYGRDLSKEAVSIYWAGLADMSIAAVKASLNAHVRDVQAGQFMPKIADIRRGIETAAALEDGHPGPEEAWAIALPARSESATVVWTQQISSAFYEAAMPLLEGGDKIAARKAFLERYESELRDARRAGVKASWTASLGSSPDMREKAIEAAVRQNRIRQEHAAKLLPYREQIDGGAIQAIENGLKDQAMDGQAAKSNILALRAILKGRAA